MTKAASTAARNDAAGRRVPAPSGRIQGTVERLNLAQGIEGWAIDLEDPGRRLSIELLIDDDMIARVTNQGVRSDLPIVSGRAMRIGFAFPATTHDRIRHMIDAGLEGALSIRVVETGLALPLPEGCPTLLSEFPREAEDSLKGLDLLAHLSTLRNRAAAFTPRPLRADGDHGSGFIEQVAIDEEGLVWFCGWMKRAIAADMPVLIIDGQKLPAGMAITMFPRDDLEGDACGVVGVFQSDWRPTTTSELFVFLDDQQSYLQGVKALGLISKSEFAEFLSFRWPHCRGGHRTLLRHLFDHPDSWEPIEGLSGARVRASVEQLFVLPSFGCLAAGWAISPIRNLSGVALKFGTTILHCDPKSLSFRTRPDLIPLAAGCDQLTGDAGFVAVFQGQIGQREIDDVTLKIILADGSSSNHLVDAGAIRLLGHAASMDQLLHLYPTLVSEPFFPELAQSLCAEARSAAERLTVIETRPCKHVLIFAVPAERSDAYLLFNEVERRLKTNPIPHGIGFVAGRGLVRSDALALFTALTARIDNPCGLYLVDEPAAAFYAIPEVLVSTGAESFAFFGAGLIATEQGFDAAACDDGQLAVFEVCDPCGLRQNEVRSLEAMRWNRAALLKWLSTAPPYLHGPRTNAAALIEAATVHCEQAAWFLRPDAPLPLVRAMNAALAAK